MKKYKVTLTVTADEFMPVFAKLRGVHMDVEEIPPQNGADKDVRAEPVHRRKRGSKVVDTILKTLEEAGPNGAELKELRSDLGRAGLSENSLSTGLAILQKDGRVKRADDGFYSLAAA